MSIQNSFDTFGKVLQVPGSQLESVDQQTSGQNLPSALRQGWDGVHEAFTMGNEHRNL